MDEPKQLCNAPICGAYTHGVVAYCALEANHPDRHQRAIEVQGGYRNVPPELVEALLPSNFPMNKGE